MTALIRATDCSYLRYISSFRSPWLYDGNELVNSNTHGRIRSVVGSVILT